MLSEMKNEREFDWLTAPGSAQGKRSDLTSGRDDTKSKSDITQRRLRAILRAPGFIQQLYRDGLISQEMAAHLRPAENNVEGQKQAQLALAKIRAIPCRGMQLIRRLQNYHFLESLASLVIL